MRYLSHDVIYSLLSRSEIIQIVKQGLQAHANNEISVPDRMHLHQSENTYLLMPAISKEYYCTKLVNIHPDNTIKGIPSIQGAILLMSSETGKTLAHMEAAGITALRTGAVGAIGAEMILDESDSKLGIIGFGEQSVEQVLFTADIHSFNQINCFSRSRDKFHRWSERLLAIKPELNLILKGSAEDLVRDSDLIISATNSEAPVFSSEGIDIHSKKFISVGSYKPQMQEFPESVYHQADKVIVDTLMAGSESGDIKNALEQKWIDESELITIGDILNNKISINPSDTYVVKSVGMAALDLALSAAVYNAALKKDLGTIL